MTRFDFIVNGVVVSVYAKTRTEAVRKLHAQL